MQTEKRFHPSLAWQLSKETSHGWATSWNSVKIYYPTVSSKPGKKRDSLRKNSNLMDIFCSFAPPNRSVRVEGALSNTSHTCEFLLRCVTRVRVRHKSGWVGEKFVLLVAQWRWCIENFFRFQTMTPTWRSTAIMWWRNWRRPLVNRFRNTFDRRWR